MTHEPCPQPDHLRSFVSSTVNSQLAGQILTHIETCPACEQTVTALEASGDTLVDRIRKSVSQPSFAHEPECQRLMQSLFDETVRVRGLTQDDSTSMPLTLREYRIIRKLGEGGMGTVYLAEHQRLKRQVALKLLPSSRLGNSEAIARFDREMAVLGQFTHPHIVQAFDAGVHEGQHFLAMEYVDGLTLTELVQRQSPLKIADACELIHQAALGLQYAHENGFVHRDIKPSNLMLAKSGTRTGSIAVSVKVLDLGLARALQGEGNPAEQMTELTTAGQVMGTIDYMAPEQGGDSHQVDIRADIYSLGATFYKLLTGESPFAEHARKPVLQRLMTIAQQEPTPIQVTRPEVPAALVLVVERMMAKSPEQRFTTPAEVAEALLPFTQGADLPPLLGLPSTTTSIQPRSVLPKTKLAPSEKHRFGGIENRRWRIALLGIPVFLLLSTILVLATRNGAVEVTAPDGKLPEDVKVIVSRGGDEVELLQVDNHWSARIVNGEYQVELRGGKDRFAIKDSKLTVSRMGRTRIELVLKPKPVEASPQVAAAKPSAAPAKAIPDADGPTPRAPAVENSTPFVLLRGEQVIREFKTLAGAVADMHDADVIEIRSSGRIPVRLTDSPKYALTIRAGAGFRPWLDFLTLPALGLPHDLTFEGCDLDLRSQLQSGGPEQNRAKRVYRQCRVWGGVGQLRGSHLEFSDCVIVSTAGLSHVESVPTETSFENCLIHNLDNLLVFYPTSANLPESTPVCQHKLRIEKCTYYGMATWYLSLVNVTGPNHVVIEANNNVFHCDSQTGSLISAKSTPSVTWHGNDNCFSGPWHATWRLNDVGEAKQTGVGLDSWRKLWPDAELNSREVPRLALEWSRIQRLTGPERLREIRDACESRAAAQQMPPLELNWELIGPGDAYLKALAAEGRPVAETDLRPERLEGGPITLIRNGAAIAGFATLQQAADTARDRDAIEIRSDDSRGDVTLNGRNRLLTLRAAPGYAPSITGLGIAPESTDRLILEGLSLENVANWSAGYGSHPTPEKPLFPGKGVLVRMQNCRGDGHGWMEAEDGAVPEIRNCDLSSLGVGLKSSRVRISNSVIAAIWFGGEFGASVPPVLEIDRSVFWNPDPFPIQLHGGSSPLLPMTMVAVESRRSVYVNSRGQFNLFGIPWSGEKNVFQLPASGPLEGTTRLDDWQIALKSDFESVELRPFEFDPAQWRILRGKSDKYEPRPDGSDYGADIDQLIEALTPRR